MIRRMLARPADRGRDDGLAMIMVIAVGTVLMLLVVSATAYAVGSQRKARGDQDWNSALAAAYAGIEEYQSRLANDPGYFVFGNPAATFSTASASTVALPEVTGGPGAANPAFELGAGANWSEVAGSGGASAFRYEIDNSKYYATGNLRIRSTGLSGGQTRTIVADLRQVGFIKFLYFTNYEIIDPAVSGSDPVACERYRYDGRSTATCGSINFITADTINGPMHTNDGFQVSGDPTFNGLTTTSYDPLTGNRFYGTGSPHFTQMPDNKPGYLAPLAMPATNSELKKETRPDRPIDVPRPGCLYTGPTTIEFTASGNMVVRSPWTKYTSPVTGTNNAGCGTPGGSGLASATGQVLNAPDNNVIYVQNVPATVGDANYWATGEAGTPVCLPEDRTVANGRNAAGNPVGYPLAGEYVANADVYGCKNGDAFVKGTVNAKVTVASENYIYITDDIVYANDEDDILGLVGQNAVWVHNPTTQSSTPVTTSTVLETRNALSRDAARTLTGNGGGSGSSFSGGGWTCTRTGGSGGGSIYRCERMGTTTTYNFSMNSTILNNADYVDRKIDAAILSVAHTFMVQNYNKGGDRGTLTVNGAIAQKFRGTVGTGSVSTGYRKSYNYDERFRYVAPPKFLSPVTTVYGVNVWVEVSPAMNPDGSYP